MAGPVGQQNTTSLSWRVRVFPADDVSNMSGSERGVCPQMEQKVGIGI